MTLEEMHRLTVEQIIKETFTVEFLKTIPVEKRIEGLSVDELLAALTPQTREALAHRLKDGEASPKQD
jgi:hypothetical protein